MFMNNKINLSLEESFAHYILFDKNNFDETQISSINFEEVIKRLSSELMLPAFYYNLKVKKKLRLIPYDLNNYLSEIFEINSNRNKKLIRESGHLSKILIGNNINHLFLKGTAYLNSGLYSHIGERMVGDICSSERLAKTRKDLPSSAL